MKMKRLLALLLSLCMVFSLVPANAVHAEGSEELEIEKLDNSEVSVDLTQDIDTDLKVNDPEIDANESVKVIIVMEGESIIQNNGAAVLDLETEQQMDQMEMMQQYVVALIEEDVLDGEELEVNYNYTWLLNGIATQVPYGAIEEIEALDGVERVLIQPVYSVCETTESVADPMTSSDGEMIGRESAWAQGYTGEGMKIAVIDTGLDIDHQNFQALGEDKLTDTSADVDTVGAVLSQLNASSRIEGLTVEDVYHSTKVPYGFNYCDDNLDITHDNDSQGDHGTHVAGIAAANKVEDSEVVGVAPDSQLYIMKVFGANGGAYSEDILAALEDALMLDADVINMSLGSPAGFTSSNYEEVNEIYNRVMETDTVLCVSAGNNYNSGYANNWGTNMNLTENPDNGVLGSPGTYTSSFTVASVENWMVETVYIDADGYRIVYTSGSNSSAAGITSLTGEYEFVVVPGNGEEADYEGLDVTGKVALVQRGVISFADKHMIAESKGAVACIVYNNVSTAFGMDLTGSTATIPCVSISMEAGLYLAAAQEENPELTLSFPDEVGPVPNEDAYEMSDFSSWGVAPDLSLEPDITAPGGNIYSTIDNGEYGLMSGTSMSSPNVAGMAALVMQYVKENFDESTDYRALVQNLLMSTADPLSYDEESGLDYSPRSQGSGLANVFGAVTTQAYLSVDGEQGPKVSLGDDADRSGSYGFNFDVHNFSDSAAYYDLATTVQTEDIVDYYGVYFFMSGTPLALSAETEHNSENMVLTYDVDDNGETNSHDAYYVYRAAIGEPEVEGWESESFRYDLNGDDAVTTDDVQAYLDELVGKDANVDLDDTVLKVAAGETAQVGVTVVLSDEDKTYFDTYYTNGGYVEGYTMLTALHTEGVDLSLPYLAFYGDWAEAPVLDDGYYWDYFNTGYAGNQYLSVLFTEYGGDDYGYYPGVNVYVDEPVDPSHISLSPDDNGYFDTISDIYVSTLRNAASLTFRYSNQETGEVYYELSEENVSKSVYYSAYGQIVPYVYTSIDGELYDFTDNEGNTLTNNTKLLLEVEAVGVDADAEAETWAVPITIDLEAPELLGASKTVDLDTGKKTLTLTFSDNVSVSVVALMDSIGNVIYALDGVEDTTPDENGYQNYTVSYDVTNLGGKVMVVLSDYALNESYFGVNLGGEGASYGELVGFQYANDYYGTTSWVSFNTAVDCDETQVFLSEMDFVCAEYVNGYVFAQTDDGSLYGFRYEDMLNDTLVLESTYVAQLDNVYQDLAYSYAEGKLYGLYLSEDDGYPTTEIYSINLNGEDYGEAYQEDWTLGRGGLYGLALAIDDAGTLYVLGSNYDWETEDATETAHLWSVGMEYNSWSDSYYLGYRLSDLGDIGLSMDYLQSMTWDHNTEKLYWARFTVEGMNLVSELIEVAVEESEETDEYGDPVYDITCTKLGNLTSETCALFAPLSETSAAKEEHSNVPEMDSSVVGTPILRESTVTMNIGGIANLTYDIDPWYSDYKTVVWSSNDESIATVDQDGTVTAVNAGSATITLASAVDAEKYSTCTVEVTALDLKFEGIISVMGEGIAAVYEPGIYTFEMTDGVPSFEKTPVITAPDELNYGLSLATSENGRGSLWACEYGNTGMIYEIDAETGEVKDVLQPIDGDMMFGLSYSEATDSFAGIMDMYLYVDLPMTHEAEEEMLASYNEETNEFTWHKINLLPYLQEMGENFVTGETGQGASSEVVFCGITALPESSYQYMSRDFNGGWGEIYYTKAQTLVLLDNVGRLWYIDEVRNMTAVSDEWGNTFYSNEDGSSSIYNGFHGVEAAEVADGVYNVYVIREVAETPLTDMFRAGTLPRITYHFSDIEFAGYTAEGSPMFAMSLYDYWNNGTTNELYLHVPGVGTGETVWNPIKWCDEEVKTPDRLYSLGNTGEYNFIASIHTAEVTGGVDAEEQEETGINPLAVGIYVTEY